MSSSVEYIKDNKQKYDDFKIIKNNLVIIPPDPDIIKETNILPIITNISYDKDGNVKLDNFIYHYLQTKNEKYNIKENKPGLDIDKTYKNIIIYKNSGNKYKCYILNGSTIKIKDLFNSDNAVKDSIANGKNNFEEYYLNYKNKEEYIRFKIFTSLIIIPIDDNNLIIFDYYKSSPLIIPQNIVAQDVSITNTEFENLNKLVITKAIYEDNPFDYLSEPQQS